MSLVAGCGGEKKEDAKASDVIKVGVFLPLTGDNAAGGELELRGIKLANKLHPEVLGKKIELVVADNKSDKAEAASVAARLIEKDKVSVIVGSYGSSLSMAAGNIVKDSKVPAVGTSCTNPQVTANNDYYFRACFIDPFQGTVMANYAFKQGAKKVAIVQEVSNDYAVGLAKFFKEAFIIKPIIFDKISNDFYTISPSFCSNPNMFSFEINQILDSNYVHNSHDCFKPRCRTFKFSCSEITISKYISAVYASPSTTGKR